MAGRTSKANWKGEVKTGGGELELASGLYKGPYTFVSRFEDGEGTNPEELLAAAHASCFSMALSNLLSQDGNPPDEIRTEATVHVEQVDGAPTITKVELSTHGEVPGVDAAAFEEKAAAAKDGCPVSKLFAGGSAEITLEVSFG